MTARLIDGKAHALAIRAEIAVQARALIDSHGVTPHLVVALVGDDPASAVYVRNKEIACEKAGFRSTVARLPASTSQAELLAGVAAWNADPSIHGILVQLPVPPQIDPQAVLDAISPLKDVDCFHAENVGLMAQGRPRFMPCTPYGVQQLLVREGIETAGRHVVILGRSEIVGKPQALLMMQKGVGGDATVTVCHSRTQDLAAITRTADILVAAIGKPELVRGEHLSPGVVVIDVGTNRVGEKLVGDVCFAEAVEIASAITPVPGGVGPMTIAMLLRNTLAAAELAAGRNA
jgi:methylenetetrahydrofolate dehydrogenase (NADP+)/methenyltetrahydrofolate cyclohydrolase